ncbi:hypothetical protein Gpo141_00008772 [Globisporangium polare]
MDRRGRKRSGSDESMEATPATSLVVGVRMATAAGAAARARAGSADDTSASPADDKVLRRRLQYKMHQRRHRAKQKVKIETLEQEVHVLLADVSRLEIQCKRLQQRSVFNSRGTMAGAPLRVVREYFSIYEYGFSPRRHGDQERFLQCVMSSGIEGPDYVGVDVLKHQWRLYGQFFASTRYDIKSHSVTTVGDMTIVVVDATLNIRPRRDGVTSLCPNLTGNEELIQEVIGNVITIPGKYRFMFDVDGSVSWFGADLDFVGGLQRTLGSLEKVSAFMKDAQISFGTGQIQCRSSENGGGSSRRHAEPDCSGDPRHNVDFLLS